MRQAALVVLLGCGSAPPPPVKNTAPPAQVAAKPARPASAFGRFTAVAPEGYSVDLRQDHVAFERGNDILIMVVDGADQNPAQPAKCLGQLEAFAAGVVTGINGGNVAITVDVIDGKQLPKGCKLTGKTSSGDVLVESAVMDLGNGGVAFAILLHKRADDGSSAAFGEVVASIAKKP